MLTIISLRNILLESSLLLDIVLVNDIYDFLIDVEICTLNMCNDHRIQEVLR